MSSSSAAAGTLNELETKIGSLERSNFDLKLRLHYLNNKYGSVELSRSPLKASSRGGHEYEGNLGEEMEALQEENEYSKRRIIELESELLQLQLVREKEAEQYQKALKLKPNTAVHLEEQRKREREVSMAIAEHDAVLIDKLREELQSAQQQRLTDQRIIEELNQLLLSQQKTYEGKDEEIVSLKAKVEELTKINEQQASDLQRYSQQPQPPYGNIQFPGVNGPSPSLALTASTTSSSYPNALMANAATTTTTTTKTSFSPSRVTSPQTITVVSDPNGTQQVIFSSLAASSAESTAATAATMRPNPSSKEAYNVFVENQVLKDRLETLQQSIRRQEEVIASMQSAATSMGSIESDEIARLEVELTKAKDERDAYKAQNARLEGELERTMQELFDRRKAAYYGHPPPPLPSSFSFDDRYGISAIGGVDGNAPYSSRGSVESLYSSRDGSLQRGGFGSGGVPDAAVYERTIDLYKQREVELMMALEGVVKRCQELEDRFIPDEFHSRKQQHQQYQFARSSLPSSGSSSASRRLRPSPEALYPTSVFASRNHNGGSSSTDRRVAQPPQFDRFEREESNGVSASGYISQSNNGATKGRYRR